jgi:hypothetical protein
MDIKNIMVIGVGSSTGVGDLDLITRVQNRDLSYTIVDALFNSSDIDTKPRYNLSIITYPSQSPYLPAHVPANRVAHKTSDFSSTSLVSVFAGQDLVISTIAEGAHDLQVRIINAAVDAGVRHFIPYEFGQDSLNTGVQERIPQGAIHAKTLDYLRHVSSTNDAFDWVAVAVGCVLDSMLVSGDLGFDLQ